MILPSLKISLPLESRKTKTKMDDILAAILESPPTNGIPLKIKKKKQLKSKNKAEVEFVIANIN